MEAIDTTPAQPTRNGGSGVVSREAVIDAIAHAREDVLGREEFAAALQASKVEIQTLKEALRTRTVIGEAVGLLMCESTITAEAAFTRLVEMSSHQNVKLREVAARLVEEANARATG